MVPDKSIGADGQLRIDDRDLVPKAERLGRVFGLERRHRAPSPFSQRSRATGPSKTR